MNNFTIKTRLMIILILVSVISCAVLGYFSSEYGRKIISAEVTDQLVSLKTSKKDQIESYLGDIGKLVEVLGQDETVIQATKDFRYAYDALSSEKLNAECSDALGDFYNNFISQLGHNISVKPDIELFYPNSVVACYLQFEYIIDNPNPVGHKNKMEDANDRSEYSNVHRKYHSFFNLILEKFDFYDIFLIDIEKGDILYSVYKEVDFATNLYTGPYRTSNLADLSRKLNINRDLQKATWQDFASYRPSYGAPASFIGIPLSENGVTIGGLVFQLPVDEINRIMTSDQSWEEAGMGESGEVYLIGEDHMMRSISRFYLQDTAGYTEALVRSGVSEEEVDLYYRFGTTILQQKVSSPTVEAALGGDSDTQIIKDYRGVDVVSSYSLLELAGLKWALLAEMDYAEAFAPVANFDKRIFIQTIILSILVTLIAMFFANRFVRPIEVLSEGAQKIIAGDSSHRVTIKNNDEFGRLGLSFNTMVEELDTQKSLLKEQSALSENILLNFIPSQIANRLKKGETAFADEYINVSLVAIDLVGFSNLTEKVGASASLEMLNEIIDAFDDCAVRNHVDKIRTVGDTYFASCGLLESRLDHAKRVIFFAKEARQLIGQVNLNHSIDLKLHISVNSGSVIAGIVGHNRYNFDVWGKDVNLLFRMTELEIDNEIIVSEEVVNRLQGVYEFEQLEDMAKINNTVYKLVDK